MASVASCHEYGSAEPVVVASELTGCSAAEPSTSASLEPSAAESATCTMTTKAAPRKSVKHDKPGHPRKVPLPPTSKSVVTVVGKDMIDSRTNVEYKSNDVSFCLSIPNRLLVAWYKKAAKMDDYLSLLNELIEDRVVAIREDSESLALKLYKRSALVHNEVRKKAGRGRELLLECQFVLPVCVEDAVTVEQLQAEICELKSDLASAIKELVISQDAIDHMSLQLNGLLMERDEMVNNGKKITEVGRKQQKRKIAHFKTAAEGALWFAESFGLIPECLDVRLSGSEERVKISFTEEQLSQPKQPKGRQVDEEIAVQTLYLLDRFGVSDEFYHELTQVQLVQYVVHVVLCQCTCLSSGVINVIMVDTFLFRYIQLCSTVTLLSPSGNWFNSEVEVVSVANGAYCPLKASLSTVLQHVVRMIKLSVFFVFFAILEMFQINVLCTCVRVSLTIDT